MAWLLRFRYWTSIDGSFSLNKETLIIVLVVVYRCSARQRHTHRFFTTVLVGYQERALRRGKTSRRCRPV